MKAAVKDNKDLNRSWIVRVGKRARRFINPTIKKYSRIGDGPVLDNKHFPWIDELERHTDVIRAEAESILRFEDAIPPISLISPDHKNLDDEQKWLSYFLWGYENKSPENCARCPETTRFVESIPGMTTALFSIHKPGMRIKPHKGVTAGICVAHLGLRIPKKRENCAIRVDDQVLHWADGKVIVFDDTYQHETWNNTDEYRIILLLHIKRPVRFPGSVLSNLFMGGIKRTPFIRDAIRNMNEWEQAYQRLEHDQAQAAE